MSDTNPISTNQWIHYYQETAASPAAVSGGLKDGATMKTGFPLDNASSLGNSSTSSTIISPGGGGNSSTSPLGSPLKPIRRRSRASKRTPVTLLNASATNFRALVQQFTGCPHATAAAATQFGRQKGPVNLNFERNDNQLSTETTSSRYGNYNQQQITPPTLPQRAQGTFSQGSSISDPTNIQSSLDDFVMENVSLQNEFIHESSINGTSSNGGYFF